MDSLIENDTQELHWTLSPPESRNLLEAVFPDHALFSDIAGSLNRDMTPSQLLEKLRDQGIYKRNDLNKGTELWQQYPSCHGKSAEPNMAKFLNDILRVTANIVGKFKVQQSVPLSHLTHSLIDTNAQNMACKRSHSATQRFRRVLFRSGTVPTNFRSSHRPHLLRSRWISLHCAIQYPRESRSVSTYFTRYLYGSEGQYRV